MIRAIDRSKGSSLCGDGFFGRVGPEVLSLHGVWTNGTGTLVARPAVAGGGSVHVLLDVVGYFE